MIRHSAAVDKEESEINSAKHFEGKPASDYAYWKAQCSSRQRFILICCHVRPWSINLAAVRCFAPVTCLAQVLALVSAAAIETARYKVVRRAGLVEKFNAAGPDADPLDPQFRQPMR